MNKFTTLYIFMDVKVIKTIMHESAENKLIINLLIILVSQESVETLTIILKWSTVLGEHILMMQFSSHPQATVEAAWINI